MNRRHIALTTALAAVALLVAACGSSADSPNTPALTDITVTQSATASPGNTPAASETPDDVTGDLQPCDILTSEEVAPVLPDPDDGSVEWSGGSLMEGVDAYQCSYTNPALDLFTVVINIAANDERFDWIEPDPSAYGSEAREVDVADGGWLRGDESEMKFTAVDGLAVIDLDLMATGADEHAEALIELARMVADRIE